MLKKLVENYGGNSKSDSMGLIVEYDNGIFLWSSFWDF